MSTNNYFKYYDSVNEQKLVDDLVVEAIKNYGLDVYYLPRTPIKCEDKPAKNKNILNENRSPVFNKAIKIEMYVKTVEGFGGEGDILTKFGMAIRDTLILCVSRKRFAQEIEKEIRQRPMEGDVIYFPLNKKIFEITHAEQEPVFYQNGALQFFDLNTELFTFSNEEFCTGIEEIDSIYEKFNTSHEKAIENLEDYDDFASNETIQELSNKLLDFSEKDPFSKGGKW